MSGIDLSLARKAHRLGLSGQELGQKLGLRASEANTLAAVGRHLVAIDAAALTDAEILLLQTIASLQRAALKRGETRSPESRSVSRILGKAPSWCASTCRKRLFTRRHDKLRGREVRGFGFVDLAGNGFVRLTDSGWAVVHALDGQP